MNIDELHNKLKDEFKTHIDYCFGDSDEPTVFQYLFIISNIIKQIHLLKTDSDALYTFIKGKFNNIYKDRFMDLNTFNKLFKKCITKDISKLILNTYSVDFDINNDTIIFHKYINERNDNENNDDKINCSCCGKSDQKNKNNKKITITNNGELYDVQFHNINFNNVMKLIESIQ